MDALERMNYSNTASMAASGVPYYQFTDIYKEKILAHYNDPSQPAAFPDPNNPNKWLMSGNTNWEDVLFRKSYPMQQNSAAISGGTDHFDYYTSLSYLNQDGLSKQSDENYKRYNFLSNFNVNVTKWLRIGTRASVNIGNKIWGPLLGEANTTLQPFRYSNWPVYAPDGSYAWDGSVPNAVQLQKEGGYQKKDNLDMWLTGYAKFTPVKNMTFNIDYSYNATNTNTLNYWRRLPEYYIDGTLAKYYPGTNPSQVTKTNYRTIYSAFNAFADYENAFGKHTIKALLGFNQEHSISENLSARREQLIQETIPYLNLAYGTSTVGDGATEFAIRGAFSRLNYNFDNRYLIEFNNRYDGTSKFPKKDRFKFFPSVSIGWRLDNEAFFAGLKDIVNMLKFKASYGNLGNQNVINNYPYVPTYSTALVDYLINGALPMANYAPGLVREALTWETVTQQNIGLELALLENRLHTNVDVYRRDTKNMLTKGITLPALLANPEPNENAADLKTTGFDLELEWRDRIKSLNYGITVLLSDNTSFITKYDNPKGIISDYYVGRELSEIWGFDTGGIFQTDEAAKALDQSNITGRQRKAGDLWFKDLNGDGKITYGSSTLLDPGDRKIIGNSNPRYNFGIKSEIEWKGFDLTLFFQGVGKRDLAISNTFWVGGYTDEWSARNKKMTDWWTKENPDAYFPRPLLVIGTDVTASQTRFLQNGAYIRLKQLTLGYTIPMNLSQKAKIEKIRVYFSGNNLWELTDIYKNVIDPEMNNLMNNPIFRSFSIGANINF
jgi:TonB-linked SusC/RagA family outer membrane protein